ncbi:peptidase S66 [Desulfosarcina widdelii]|uniref:Peptidase S66 n=1 Tax=Desulfosarcina widdelii TaxID=947919 RepID=A0A5K7ZQ43_9BACT|nr:LD-carboxypeptidase [Desulfosarcina widdelii]BBO78967.1 peptidase S66 [Desulfosarcina widdelii]
MPSSIVPQTNLPRALKPGDRIGIAAPASPFDGKSFEAGLGVLESMGFNPVVPEGLFEKNGFLAGTDRHRADQLTRLFTDPEIDGIICARGGYGSMRILPLLDADVLAKHPKVFVGFSDITALIGFLVQRCGMTVFHGPSVTTLGDGNLQTREHLMAALTRAEPLTLTAEAGRTIHSGRAQGPFLCGNLTLFCHLTGTPFQPDLKDRILLIEDRGEAPYRIDRMLTQMRMAGCFQGLAGLAVGAFTDCGSSRQINEIVADRLSGLDIPILAGFDAGHEGVNMTLPVGVPARLDTASKTLSFLNPAVR